MKLKFRHFFLQAIISDMLDNDHIFVVDDKCALLSTHQRIINGIDGDWMTNNGRPFFAVQSKYVKMICASEGYYKIACSID